LVYSLHIISLILFSGTRTHLKINGVTKQIYIETSRSLGKFNVAVYIEFERQGAVNRNLLQ